LPILHGAAAIPLLLLAAFVLSLWINPPWFTACLATYYLLTLAYSLRLKQVLMLDAIVLAGLYTLRIIAGATAAQVTLSFLAAGVLDVPVPQPGAGQALCRTAHSVATGELSAQGRGYHVDDLAILQSLGGSAGYLAVLVLALYINSPTCKNCIGSRC